MSGPVFRMTSFGQNWKRVHLKRVDIEVAQDFSGATVTYLRRFVLCISLSDQMDMLIIISNIQCHQASIKYSSVAILLNMEMLPSGKKIAEDMAIL